ncbi:MAG: single-stranded DNA-binding protein, partial [Candidatus Thorarchaeota archaeon]
MPNLNKVFLMGHLTRDPNLRYTPQGTAVADSGIAVNRQFNQQQEVMFVDLTFWAKQAELVSQ